MFFLSKDVTTPLWTDDDQRYMLEAIRLAELARGRTAPNPLVGAVVVRDGRIVGKGYHAQAGGPHAEVVALTEAGDQAVGATMYVTLEPCSHHGRTPPCANLAIRSGLQRVVAAMQDPNPLVAGNGLARLKDANIQTEVGLLENEARALNEIFITYITQQRPFIHFKTAMSLDGKIACYTGASQWITGPEARAEVHRLRSLHDAILVPIGTVLADDPQLTVRLDPSNLPNGPIGDGQPIRIIVDSRGRIPLSARCLHGAGADAEVIVAMTDDVAPSKIAALRSHGVRIWTGPSVDGHVDIKALTQDLAQLEISSVFVESGPTFAGALFDAGLVDRVTAFIAPLVLGGAGALSPVAGAGVPHPDDGWFLERIESAHFGRDLMITGIVGRE